MGIQNCYTLENSLMGYVTEEGEIKQYTEKDLAEIGMSIWKGVFVLESSSQLVKKVLGYTK